MVSTKNRGLVTFGQVQHREPSHPFRTDYHYRVCFVFCVGQFFKYARGTRGLLVRGLEPKLRNCSEPARRSNIQQLFFEIEVNSGRIFTEPRSGEVNILPLFTEIEKNNCFSIYTLSDLNNIFRRKPLKIDSDTLAKREFTPAILFLFGLRIIHSVGGE